MNLTLPTQRDPLARLSLVGLVIGAMYAAAALPGVAPAQAEPAAQIIIIATPTLGIEPTPAPALAATQPTPAAPVAIVLPTEPPAQPPDAAPADYLANVVEQAPHSPRGDNRGEIQIIPTAAPEPSQVDPNAAAVEVPTIDAAQAALIVARAAGGCQPGQVFIARVGCHTPGIGGAQPGAVAP